MQLVDIFIKINESLAIPTTLLFLFASIILTIKTKFIQIRALPKLFKILNRNWENSTKQNLKTVSPLRALFSAMTTTMGVGNIVGPAMAISIGGPGALLWLIIY